MSPPLIRIDGLTKDFPIKRPGMLAQRAMLRAVDNLSFAIASGETLGLVGES
jgi:ABC-type oligopeptide transport system ATPase subunit